MQLKYPLIIAEPPSLDFTINFKTNFLDEGLTIALGSILISIFRVSLDYSRPSYISISKIKSLDHSYSSVWITFKNQEIT